MTQHWRRSFVLIALVSSGCLPSCATYSGPVGAISNIVVGEAGSDSRNESCNGFSVSAADAKQFFRRAVLITPRQEHDFYLHGPCYVRGTLSTKYETWHWEIRNLGTARLTSEAGDDTFLLADPRHESSLADE